MPLENIFAREAQKFKLLIGKVGSSKKKKAAIAEGKGLGFCCPLLCLWAVFLGKTLGKTFETTSQQISGSNC